MPHQQSEKLVFSSRLLAIPTYLRSHFWQNRKRDWSRSNNIVNPEDYEESFEDGRTVYKLGPKTNLDVQDWKQPYWVHQNMEKPQLFWALQKLLRTGIFSLCQASEWYRQSTMQLLKCRERLHTTWIRVFLSLSVKKANLKLTLPYP